MSEALKDAVELFELSKGVKRDGALDAWGEEAVRVFMGARNFRDMAAINKNRPDPVVARESILREKRRAMNRFSSVRDLPDETFNHVFRKAYVFGCRPETVEENLDWAEMLKEWIAY